MNVRLRPFDAEDLPRFTQWLSREHVKPWYSPAEDWLTEVLARDGEFAFIRHWIILADDVPVGFCQHYPYWRSGESWHGLIPLEGTYSIDYLIGEPSHLRRGIGAQAIRLLVEDVFKKPEARRIIVQPDEENQASRRALLAAGFTYDPPNGLYLLTKPRAVGLG